MSSFAAFARTYVAAAIIVPVLLSSEPLLNEYFPGATPATLYIMVLGVVTLYSVMAGNDNYRFLGIRTAVAAAVGALTLAGGAWWTATTSGSEGVVILAVAWILIPLFAQSLTHIVSAYSYGGGLEESLAKVERKKAS